MFSTVSIFSNHTHNTHSKKKQTNNTNVSWEAFMWGKEHGHANLAFQYTSDGSTFYSPITISNFAFRKFRTSETYQKGQSEQYIFSSRKQKMSK